jgi:PKD repeat protein
MLRRLARLAVVACAALCAPAAALAEESGPTPLAFTVAPDPATVGKEVTFTVVPATPADPNVAWTYTWDTDGDPSTPPGQPGTSATRVYETAGTYKVTLYADDGSGNPPAEVSRNVTVQDPPPQPPPTTASFTIRPRQPQVGQEITLTSTSTGTGLTYLWSANGGDAYIANPSDASTIVAFGKPGTWYVTLEITDANGQKARKRRAITVSALPPPPKAPPNVPTFTYSPGTPKAGESVFFKASATDPDGSTIESIDWDFNSDGVYDASGVTVQRTFPNAGDYIVTVRANNDGGSRTSFQTIFISDPGSTTGSPPSTGSNPGNSGSPPTANPGGQGQADRTVRLLNPFPRVRLSGTVLGSVTTVRRLSITAPRGATVRVRCRGRGCPRTLASSVARDSRRALRVRRFERRLRAGARLEIYVTRKNRIGSYTRFTIRRGAAPRRFEACVRSYPHKPVKCPDPGDG